MNSRLEQLDAVRGMASFTVVLHHLYLALPMLPLVFRDSPMRVLVNGHAPVIMFYVLSGFVLALPWMSRSVGSYRSFVIRRICRIYIPYIVSILAAVLLASLLAHGSIPGIIAWQSGMSIRSLLEHLTLVYNTDTQAFNNVVWSLVHEMRISLFFPLLVWCVRRFNWRINLLICLLLSAPTVCKPLMTLSYGYATILETLHYTSMFIIGALLAKNKETLTAFYLQWSQNRRWLILAAVFVLYAYSTVINSVFLKIRLPNEFVVSDYAAALASGVFIIYSLASAKISSILIRRPLLFLGQISYSLYLYHLLVLFSLMYLLYGTVPNFIIYISTIVISVLLAALSWRFVETPAIRLGRRLTQPYPAGKDARMASGGIPPSSA